MPLVRAILKGIADDRTIDSHRLINSAPLKEFIEQYNRIAAHNDNLPVVTSLTTGEQLKAAVEKMDPDDQVALLYKYSVATQTAESLPTPAPVTVAEDEQIKADARNVRVFMVKAMITMVAVFACIIVGATVAISVKSGVLTDTGVINTIMNTAGQIIRLIISLK